MRKEIYRERARVKISQKQPVFGFVRENLSFALLTIALFVLFFQGTRSEALTVRLKDIASFEGVRDNQLIGYGLVVGLNGTGDSLQNTPYARETMVSMLERLGINVRDKMKDLNSKNVAAVMVTANLPPFSRHGTRIDVSVSAIGNAKSLQGGTLLVTPLIGADSDVYAVAQGAVAIGGFSAQGKSESSVTQGVPTVGRISNGGIIEKETGFELDSLHHLKLALRNPDFTTAKRTAEAVNAFAGGNVARAIDPTTIHINIPTTYHRRVSQFLTEIEQLKIEPDLTAKVVIDESNGVIVMGENVRISTVAVSHGNLTIRITETPQVSQPNPFSSTGTTQVVERSDINVEQGDKKLTLLEAGVSLHDLVKALNSLGVTPRDMITILRTIKSAGALQADIEVVS